MSHLFFFLLILCVLDGRSQRLWTGMGGDGRWENPENWRGLQIPQSGDQVLLDHSFFPDSYKVVLPDHRVELAQLVIRPAAGLSIEVELPSSNVEDTALRIAGPGYGLILEAGALLRNLSGAASGTPLQVADSMLISNGASYVHQTRRSHAALAAVLSRRTGTEQGSFVFDVPEASTTISLSGRHYGRLVLSSRMRGAPLTYTGSGTAPVHIRGDLVLEPGVHLSLHFTDTLHVQGNLDLEGGMLNLGNGNRSLVLSLAGDLRQGEEGMITESGTAIQEIRLKGEKEQHISATGSIQNQVGLTKAGSAPAILEAPLRLPFLLKMEQGTVRSDASFPLILDTACGISADSLQGGHVEGPLCKLGLAGEDFMFPVGSDDQLRWLYLEQGTGNITVRYIRSSPRALGGLGDDGLHHISNLEYWEVRGSPEGSAASVRLSFRDPLSGGVTSLPHLRVARLVNGEWENTGAADFRGSPGENGWVSSDPVGGFSADNPDYFALASAIGQENPLPISIVQVRSQPLPRGLRIEYEVRGGSGVYRLELQESLDGRQFNTLRSLESALPRGLMDVDLPDDAPRFFRLVAVETESGFEQFSRMLRRDPRSHAGYLPALWHSGGKLQIRLASGSRAYLGQTTVDRGMEMAEGWIYSLEGRLLHRFRLPLVAGRGSVDLPEGRGGQPAPVLVLIRCGDRLIRQWLMPRR